LPSLSKHYEHVRNVNSSSETNDCLIRLVPLAIWGSRLASDDDLYEAVRLYCGITHFHELVLESCYLYCFAIKQLIANGCSASQAYNRTLEESDRRSKISGLSTIKYWIDNDIEINDSDLPIPHYRPISYVKVSILWAFYYLKHDFTFNDAVKHIISKGGDTQANGAIIGGLIGASRGINGIERKHVQTVLTVHNQLPDVESGSNPRPREYQPGSVI
jgi:ADP-ribosyl-[dinitrogen reductase] hydrolase